MKAIFTFLILFSLSAVAQNKSGIISYEMKITLKADTTKKPFQTKAEKMLKQLTNGYVISMFHKVVYSGNRSKKYQTDAVDTSLDNTYSESTYILTRNSLTNEENNYEFEDNGTKTFTGTKKADTLKFRYTGKTKKILQFNCKEIFCQVLEQPTNKTINILAYVTTDLPASAGFQAYSNINGAIVEMSSNGRTLKIAGYKPLTTAVKSTVFNP